MIQFSAAGISNHIDFPFFPTTESSSSLDQPHLATLKHLLSRSGSGLGAESSFSSSCFWFVSISSLVLIQNKISHVFPSGWEWVQLYLQKQIYKNPRNHLYQKKNEKKKKTSFLQFFELLEPKKKQARRDLPGTRRRLTPWPHAGYARRWPGSHVDGGTNNRNDKMLFDMFQCIYLNRPWIIVLSCNDTSIDPTQCKYIKCTFKV